MRDDADRTGAGFLPQAARGAIWISLVASSSVIFSFALACATPFAALAAIAGSKMSRRDALILLAVVWLANQAIGYLALGYPRTWDSFAWGAAVGIAALLSTFAAREITPWLGPAIVGGAAAFLAAFAIYEGVLFAATAVLPSGEEAFSLPLMAWIFGINVLAFAGLLAIHRGAIAIGLLAPTPEAELSGVRI